MMAKIRNRRKRKGFTLVELIVVIAILGILAAIIIPRFTGFTDQARSTQALTNAKQIATAVETLEAEGKDYDPSKSSATEYNPADIAKRAGIDNFDADIAKDGDHTLSAIAIDKDTNIPTFSYVIQLEGKSYTAQRVASGEFNVTYPK